PARAPPRSRAASALFFLSLPSPAPLAPGPPAVLRHAAPPPDRDRRLDQDRGLPALRLPPPLVALRLGARHVERGARRHRRLARRRCDRVSRLSGAQRASAAVDRGHGLADHARPDRRRTAARTDGDRAATWRRRRPRA